MEAGDANLVATWSMVGASCAGECDDDGEVALVATGSPLPFFNLAVVHRPPAHPAAAVERITRFFTERDLEFLVWVSDRYGAGVVEAATESGLVHVGEAPGMVRPSCPAPAGPPDLSVEVVAGLDVYDRYMAVVAEGFGVPLDLITDVFRPGLFERAGVVGLLGCAGGEEVSTSAMVPAGGVAGVYNVATPERFRGRGYGEALTWAAIDAGHRQGWDTTVLQASSMGRPVYERMGFETYATYAQLGHS